MKIRKMAFRGLLALIFSTVFLLSGTFASFAADRSTDSVTPAPGNSLVLVPGEFSKANVSDVINLINKYRREACNNGYRRPGTSTQLRPSDYVPISWSGDLEWIAQTRAAEGAIYQSHTRPNGTYDCTYNGVEAYGENLAWNYGGLIRGIEQWYREKYDYVNNTGGVTGHYTSMINPNVTKIGIGCFTSQSGHWTCVAAEFSYDNSLDPTPKGVDGKCNQWMEVETSRISGKSLAGASSVSAGKTATYKISQSVTYPGIMGYDVTTPLCVKATSFSSSNAKIATINGNGVLTPKKLGTTTIRATADDGTTLSKTVSIVEPKKGATFEIKGATYKVTKKGSEVAYAKNKNAKGKVSIPATVTLCGKKYKVTSIANSAFKGNKKITQVVIGKNIKSIGKHAFYKCPKLKVVILKTKSLKSSKVGAKAFTGSKVNTVKCPSGKKTVYRKILVKKGIRKSAKFR